MNNVSVLIALINVYAYFFSLLCFFLFILTMKLDTIVSITNFKILIRDIYTYNGLIILFLNFAGLPPLFGFLGKFFILILLLEHTSYTLIAIFLAFNCFTIYFYVQHTKLLVIKTRSSKQIFAKSNLFLTVMSCGLLFLIITAIFQIETVLILLYQISFI